MLPPSVYSAVAYIKLQIVFFILFYLFIFNFFYLLEVQNATQQLFKPPPFLGTMNQGCVNPSLISAGGTGSIASLPVGLQSPRAGQGHLGLPQSLESAAEPDGSPGKLNRVAELNYPNESAGRVGQCKPRFQAPYKWHQRDNQHTCDCAAVGSRAGWCRRHCVLAHHSSTPSVPGGTGGKENCSTLKLWIPLAVEPAAEEIQDSPPGPPPAEGVALYSPCPLEEQLTMSPDCLCQGRFHHCICICMFEVAIEFVNLKKKSLRGEQIHKWKQH